MEVRRDIQPNLWHNVELYDDVKAVALNIIMNQHYDNRYELLAVSDWIGEVRRPVNWVGEKIKILLRVGHNQTGGEYAVTVERKHWLTNFLGKMFNRQHIPYVLTVSHNTRHQAWPGVEMDDLGKGLPRKSKEARDPGREIWEHGFSHYKRAPKWENQPEHLKTAIRYKYKPGSTNYEPDGTVYTVRQDGTWYHYKSCSSRHLVKQQILAQAGLGNVLAETRQYYPDDDQWYGLIQPNIIAVMEKECGFRS